MLHNNGLFIFLMVKSNQLSEPHHAIPLPRPFPSENSVLKIKSDEEVKEKTERGDDDVISVT